MKKDKIRQIMCLILVMLLTCGNIGEHISIRLNTWTAQASNEAEAFNDWFGASTASLPKTSQQITQQPTSLIKGQVIIEGGNCNIRSGPGLDYEILGSLKEGRVIEYLGQTAADKRGVDWHYVDFNGKTGWVSSKYGKIKKGSTTIEPTHIPTATPTIMPTAEPTSVSKIDVIDETVWDRNPNEKIIVLTSAEVGLKYRSVVQSALNEALMNGEKFDYWGSQVYYPPDGLRWQLNDYIYGENYDVILLFPTNREKYSDLVELGKQLGKKIHVVEALDEEDVFLEICNLYGKEDAVYSIS